MNFKVAIIGGGLAGLALAIDLQRRGHSVNVIEKGNYPRHKVCGEYISMESYNYLMSICPALKEYKLPAINKFKLSSTGKTEINFALDLGGFGISRYLLEELLYSEAKKLNVEFNLNTKAVDVNLSEDNLYSIKTSSGTINAELVCNSSGRKSNFEIKSKHNYNNEINYVGVKYHLKLKRDDSTIEIHNFPGGYCGISNIENDVSCLCYIVNSKYLKQVNNSIPEMEKSFLFRNKNLKNIFETSDFIFKDPVTISGINFNIKKTEWNDVFFLGDAAGSIAPITGNGMSMALRSSSFLSNEIDKYFRKIISKEQLKFNYSMFWKKEFSSKIKLSRYFQKLSEYSFLTNLTINLFKTFPFMAKIAMKQSHGKAF